MAFVGRTKRIRKTTTKRRIHKPMNSSELIRRRMISWLRGHFAPAASSQDRLFGVPRKDVHPGTERVCMQFVRRLSETGYLTLSDFGRIAKETQMTEAFVLMAANSLCAGNLLRPILVWPWGSQIPKTLEAVVHQRPRTLGRIVRVRWVLTKSVIRP